MNHSDYKNLTGRLAFITREADRTRLLLTMPLTVDGDGNIVATSTPDPDGKTFYANRNAIWLGIQTVDNDIAGLMDSLVDGFVEANQHRADQGNPVTADTRALHQAMAGFMSATSTPVPRWGVLYDKTRKRTGEWMGQMVSWFPDLYPPFIRGLLKDEYYKKAIRDGLIAPPFTWNGSIKDLAVWLDDNKIVSEIEPYKVSGGEPMGEKTIHKWKEVDKVFFCKGKAVTAKQLQDAFKH